MRKTILLSALLTLLVFIAQAQPVTITPPSANIDPGGSVTLTASGAMYYRWSPATGLSTTDGPVTVASPTVTTTYTCEGYAPGAESVVNGDFDQGNMGFTSSYQYNSNLWNEGTYYVDSDASLHHENFHGYGHGGTGNFMMVNGSISPGTNVWTEQITVLPNKYYAFSTWACTLAGTSSQVAWLQFSINGNQIGEVFYAPSQQYTWEQFYELWYSGNSTSATITILNQNTNGDGNDFGLDDISFRELVLVGDPNCTVYVGSMSATATADDTELCEGGSTTLHALPTGGSGHYTYSWSPANTLDNPTIQHPVATPGVGTTTYTCHIVDEDWDNSQDVSIEVTVHPTYDETTITEAICHGESYTFYGISYDHSVQISYTDHSQFGCDSIVNLDLTVYPPNDTTTINPSICVGDWYDFHGTFYNQDGQIAYFDTIDNHGCLKVEKLILSVGEYQTPPVPVEEEYVCYGYDETPYFRWDKNNREYYADAIDEVIVPDPNGGCDFRFQLDLKFHQEFYSEEEPVSVCEKYVWPLTGEVFTETNHHVVRNFHGGGGPNFNCDSTYILDITIKGQAPNPTGIRCSEESAVVFGDTIAVVTNTEFFSFQYTFIIKETNPECVWNPCKWEISKPSWTIEDTITEQSQDGAFYSKCKVYVADRDDDYVVLTAIVNNGCGSDTCKMYLKSSFLGIDENSHNAKNVNIVPNPNNGQMMLVFNNFEGKANVKVYDASGKMVDSFETYNDKGTKTMEYALDVRKGLFFFVVNGEEGTLVKKVVIE